MQNRVLLIGVVAPALFALSLSLALAQEPTSTSTPIPQTMPTINVTWADWWTTISSLWSLWPIKVAVIMAAVLTVLEAIAARRRGRGR